MNDDNRNGDDKNGTSRRWMRPTLTRIAFSTTRNLPGSAASASGLECLQGTMPELNLEDPAQREFGDYELLELIGQGGMGMVYRARQRELDREVAIKLLSAGPWASEEFIDGFRREAQNAALLQHPNIVVVHEMGEHADLIYYAMQLVRGRSLSQRLDQDGAMPPHEAAQLLRTVAEAVNYAHRLGVLHLDLKPGNILIDEHGQPLVADFGLARRLEQALDPDNEQISGTPSYMAPEQAQVRGPALSPATDVWALGAVLYEMLTGQPPFLADDPSATMRLLLEGEVRKPSRLAPVPADLEAICLRCLQKQPEHRYPDARALADDLGRFLEGRAVSVRPLNPVQRAMRWTRREPRMAVASVAAVSALVIGLVVSSSEWQRAERTATSLREHVWASRLDEAWTKLLERRSLDALPPLVQNLSEQEAAGASDAAQRSRMRIAAVLAEAPRLIDRIALGETVGSITLDPAGRWVAVVSGQKHLRLFDLASGQQRWMTDATRATHHWPELTLVDLHASRDGRYLVAGQNWWLTTPKLRVGYDTRVQGLDDGTLQSPPIPGGEDQVLVDTASGRLWMPPTARFPGFVDATFDPDGTHALIRSRRGDRRHVQFVRVADWQPIGQPQTRAANANESWLLAAQGRGIAFSGNDWTQVELLDPATLAPRHAYVHAASKRLRAWAYTPDAKTLALAYGNGDVVLLDTQSGVATALSPRMFATPVRLVFSDDGAWLAAGFTDGNVLVWDRASRRLVSKPMQLLPVPWTLHVDHHARTLFAAGQRHATLWSLPGHGGEASVLQQRPSYPRKAGPDANAIQPSRNLLATGSSDGVLRIWRLPQPQARLADLRAAPLQSDDAAFNAPYVADVDGRQVTVHDVHTGQAAGPAFTATGDIGFAALIPDSTLLVTTSGRQLDIRDWRNGRRPWPPIPLEHPPSALVISPDGQRLLIACSDADRDAQIVENYGTRNGKRMGRLELPAPDFAITWSGNGRQVLATRGNEVRVLDGIRLTALSPPLDTSKESIDVGGTPAPNLAGSDDGRLLWTVLQGTYTAAVARDLESGRSERTWLFSATPGAFLPLRGDRALLALREPLNALVVVDRNGATHTLASVAPIGWPAVANNRDGTRFATSTPLGAVIYDVDSGEWLTPPMPVPAATTITSLALDPQGNHLRARTAQGRWLGFSVSAPTTQTVGELQALISMLHPDETNVLLADDFDAATRARLRAGDPGAATAATRIAPIAGSAKAYRP